MALAKKRAEARTRYYLRDEAQRVGWNTSHPTQGGAFLEEQELVDYFPDLKFALKNDRPDFAFVLNHKPCMVIECKSKWQDLDLAVKEATEYADTINKIQGYYARIAIGVAGTPDTRVQIRASFKRAKAWVPLTSHDYPLTQIPTLSEVETALANKNGTTDVELPDEREFFSSAIGISRLLRLAKIEEAHRPKVIGAIILALYHGDFSLDRDIVIENINTNVRAAINTFGDSMPSDRRELLAQTLNLSSETHNLRPRIGDVIHQLERLNVRSIMRSGIDFLGQFYETFLRYGQDTKKLGIVFTPRHITRFAADLAQVQLGHSVYDPACGTGGFLVASFDRMMETATTPTARKKVKESLYGFDTNATVWALSVLNMLFRGDGKSNIMASSCFEDGGEFRNTFDRALLNPPFSQEGEPETDFIDHAIKTVKPGGRVVAVIKTSVLVNSDLRAWRRELVENHHVEAVITLPLDLFYPTAAPTVMLAVRAHTPDINRGTFLARIENDGFEISKKRRVPVIGSQLPKILELFDEYDNTGTIKTIPNLAMVIARDRIANGEEICAERWLPSKRFAMADFENARRDALKQMSLTVANYPDIVDELLENYEELLTPNPEDDRPTKRQTLSAWFLARNGKSTGLKNYAAGTIPFISSGEAYSGVANFAAPPEDEIYLEPCISVSCFGPANIHPWKFCARGNGGSAVRILKPRYALSQEELLWFVGQINAQRWRFHYGRMALPDRLNLLVVEPPPEDLPTLASFKQKLLAFRKDLAVLIEADGVVEMRLSDDETDAVIARERIRELESKRTSLLRGKALDAKLEKWSS